MPTTLAQINALLTGAKTQTERDFTDLHRLCQPGPHLHGIRKTYLPVDEEGERLPAEENLPQHVVEDLLDDAVKVLGRLWNLQFTQDHANQHATADVIVDGQPVLTDVPVTYLLFLEKQLVHLRTFIRKLPVLDPTERWHVDQDDAGGWYLSAPAETVRTKKVLRNHIRWEPPTADYDQPAQVDTYAEDQRVGTYTTVKLSGAVPAARVKTLAGRVERLIDAVKVAREQANSIPVTDRSATPVFEFLFAPGL